MNEKKRILFVCLGNICRSPLAEALFKHKIKQKNLDHLFDADSCGTANYHIGNLADARTIKNALQNGVTIDHIGRQLQKEDFDRFDYIFVMDRNNLRNALLLAEERHHTKIFLMRVHDPLGHGQDVPDPWYGVEENFQEVFEILDRTVEQLIQHLQKEN